MVYSRMGRIEDKKAKKRLLLALVGTIVFLAFFGIFGLKLLVGFSLLVDKLRGSTPPPAQSQTIILPPVLDALPQATKSATLTVRGSGQEGSVAIIYVNDEESKKTTVTKDGGFSVTLQGLSDGINTISAKLTDDKGNTSDLSNILSVTIKKTAPILELTAPEDNSTVNGDDNKVTISGKTEEDTGVTVNGRIIVIRSDNSFTYAYPLNAGDNKLTIIATDGAGNETTIERNVKYQR